MTARALMFQGTGSDVGKSLIVAGLCRAAVRRGLRVRPFKPQNMSNNAAVTADGGEIGRAQALQARACGVTPHSDMNPVLLKPQSEIGSQVVVQGRVWGNAPAHAYQALKPKLLVPVLESFDRLRQDGDLLLIEGAGSAAEVNLRAGDIANMGFALARQVPVCLIGDIDRGGVIAQLVGTQALLTDAERALVCGYLINKFRGDIRLFDSGLDIISQHSGWRSFGVLPFFAPARLLPPEDAMALAAPAARQPPPGGERIRIAVPQLPRIANFDDLLPLSAEPDVALRFIPPGEALPGDADLVILPGSKATLADLADLRAQGWDIDLQAHLRRGGQVLGLCGGYQMLGSRITDPEGIEGTPGAAPGLGLLALETVMTRDKTLVEVRGRDSASGAALRGYEMHIGRSEGPDRARPLLDLQDGAGGWRAEGAQSANGRVMGSYVHGLFGSDAYRSAFLARLRARPASSLRFEEQIEATLDALAEHLEAHLAIEPLFDAAR